VLIDGINCGNWSPRVDRWHQQTSHSAG
jgi:hypothetical protein